MENVNVRVGGARLERHGEVSGLSDTGVWRLKDVSGLLTATCTFAPTAGRLFAADWFHTGATFEIIESGRRTRYGRCNEPIPNDDGTWQVSAAGHGLQLAQRPAWATGTALDGSLAVTSTGNPNDAVDYAHTNLSMTAQRGSNDLTGGVTPATVGHVITILGSPTGGTFSLTYGATTISSIAYNASAATMQTNIRGFGGDLTLAVVTGSNGGPWTVTAPGALRPLSVFRPAWSLTGGTTPMVTVISGEVAANQTVADACMAWAARAGKHLVIDDDGYLSLKSDPTTPTWMVAPEVAYLGSFDENYVTHLAGCYLSSFSTPPRLAWVMKTGDATSSTTLGALMASQNAALYKVVDLTPAGPMSRVEAEANLTSRYALIGARMGWVGSIPLDRWNTWRIGGGPASPMSLREGEMIRIPDVIDSRSTPTVSTNVDLVIGELTRNHDDLTAVVKPPGFPDRDFMGGLAAAAAAVAADSDMLLTA